MAINNPEPINHSEMLSAEPTPYAVRCHDCARGGLVYMTKKCYDWQMDLPDSTWRCPRCLSRACDWDDENYEAHLGADDKDPPPDNG